MLLVPTVSLRLLHLSSLDASQPLAPLQSHQQDIVLQARSECRKTDWAQLINNYYFLVLLPASINTSCYTCRTSTHSLLKAKAGCIQIVSEGVLSKFVVVY